MLDERKLKILYAIINSYISSAEPIGSRTISKKFDVGVSSATIRNEMSDLEDMGYLNKPYSSAGRIPSDKAYRLYVDSILSMNRDNVAREIDFIKKHKIKDILLQSLKADELLENSAKILSKITNYTSLAISPQISKSKIRLIQLSSIGNKQILLVIINESDLVKSTIFKVDREIPTNQLETITNFLNQEVVGLSFEELKGLDLGLFNGIDDYKKDIDKIVSAVEDSMSNVDEIELYADGITQILNFPEYKDIDKARSIISFIENKDLLIKMLMDDKEEGITIYIGDENDYTEIKDSSIITATYIFGGNIIGKIGLIGPTRMDYVNLINTLELFSKNISQIIEKDNRN